MERPFTHVAPNGKLRMVDITHKRPSQRTALARCLVVTDTALSTLERRDDDFDPVHVARLTGVFAAKKTADIIPLCHTLNLSDIDIEVHERRGGIEVSATVKATQSTGVEMEALTACALAALSILDSLRVADPHARIDELVLLKKEGGKSGDWGRNVDPTQSTTKRRAKRSGTR